MYDAVLVPIRIVQRESADAAIEAFHFSKIGSFFLQRTIRVIHIFGMKIEILFNPQTPAFPHTISWNDPDRLPERIFLPRKMAFYSLAHSPNGLINGDVAATQLSIIPRSSTWSKLHA